MLRFFFMYGWNFKDTQFHITTPQRVIRIMHYSPNSVAQAIHIKTNGLYRLATLQDTETIYLWFSTILQR